MNETDRFRQLGTRMMAPPAGVYEEARGVIGKSNRAAASWERLYARGIIPESWMDEGRRLFVPEPFPEKAGLLNSRVSSVPASVEAAAVMAADVRGIETAEAHATEWYHRCAGMKPMPALAGFVWRVIPLSLQRVAFEDQALEKCLTWWSIQGPDRDIAMQLDARTASVVAALEQGIAERFGLTAEGTLARRVAFQYERQLVELARRWVAMDEASERGLMISPDPGRWPKIKSSVRYSSLNFPHDPHLCVWEDGYAILRTVALERDGGSVRVLMCAASRGEKPVPGTPEARRRR